MMTDSSPPFCIDVTRFEDGTVLYCLVNGQTHETVRYAGPTTRFLPPRWMVALRDQYNLDTMKSTFDIRGNSIYGGQREIESGLSPVSPLCDQTRRSAVYVCSLAELSAHAEALQPSHLVSLVPPHEQPPTPASVLLSRHLRLEIDDIEDPLPGHVLPEIEHIEGLIEFIQDWDIRGPMLLHCAAGISRSIAAALVAICIKSRSSEGNVASALRRAAPHAQPNRRVVALADRLLGRRGRLVAAVDAMGPAKAVTRGPLVCLPVALHAHFETRSSILTL